MSTLIFLRANSRRLARVSLPGPLEPGEHVLAISLHNHDCWNEDLRLAGVRLVGWNGSRPNLNGESLVSTELSRLIRNLAAKRIVEQVVVPPTSEWRWLHPVDGVDPARDDPDFHQTFSTKDFDDATWQADQDSDEAGAGFGYGDEWFIGVDIGTPSGDANEKGQRNGRSAYFRHRFTTTREHTNLQLLCQRDDGIIVYLDGVEVARDNMREGHEAYDLPAAGAVGNNGERTTYRIPLGGITLPPGEHILAISLHNTEKPSSDLRIGGISLVALEAKDYE